jgi:hypothetical protein
MHQEILRAFAAAGRPPTRRTLTEIAQQHGRTAVAMLADLHNDDFLRLDSTGRIRVAYPFSAAPTPHLMKLCDGAEVYAMCAVDALGAAAMLGTAVTVTSADPHSGEPVTVRVSADSRTAKWEPDTTVVYIGLRTPCGHDIVGGADPAADMCCGYINFFATPASAAQWASAHQDVIGQVFSQVGALQLGRQIFSPLLTGGR